MIRLNAVQYNPLSSPHLSRSLSLSPFDTHYFDSQSKELCQQFNYSKLKTFAFSKEGFLGLLLELKGTIAISEGECQALYEAGKMYESLGQSIQWIKLTKEGQLDVTTLNQDIKIDYAFISPYIMDTYVKVALKTFKDRTQAYIISNATIEANIFSDAIYFDNYKLTGFNSSGVLLFENEEFSLLPVGTIDTLAVSLTLQGLRHQFFESKTRKMFLQKMQVYFKDDLFYFVKPRTTLPYILHIGLKGVKAREIIHAMAFRKIYLSNGEGCSLGISKPSRILQHMGYTKEQSSQALQLSFTKNLTAKQIGTVISYLHFEYTQLRSLKE